jgi:hypothetical protein
MSDWVYADGESFSGKSGSVDLSAILTRNVILVDIDSPQKKITWDKAGNILQLINVDVIPSLVEVSDSYSYAGFNPTLYKFQIASGNDYRLRFKPVPWVTTFSIKVWQYFGD